LGKIDIITKNPSSEELQEYITWILTQDANNNPAVDLTGEKAARNQGRYKVWFIPGAINYENKITRTCTVPSKTEILILAATSDSSYLEHGDMEHGGAEDDNHLLEIAREIAKLHKDIEITISNDSGKKYTFLVKDAQKPEKDELQLIEAPAFRIIIPANNIYKELYNVIGGYTHLAIVAWGIKVKLEPGKYKLTLKARHDARDLIVRNLRVHARSFKLDIEYNLTAIPEKESLTPFAEYPE
jgi:hypothetical protein